MEGEDPAGDLAQPPIRAVRARDRVEQGDRVRVLRVGEEVVDRRLLGLAAGIEHEHTVGEVGDDPEVVGDHDDRRPQGVADLAHQVEDPRLGGQIERGRRLVGDQQLGVTGDRHRDHHTLPHAA